MKKLTWLLAALVAVPALAQTPVRRFALLLGANDGGPGRQQLRYAHTDAEAMARVLSELGGVAAGDLRLVAEPDRQAVLRELAALTKKIDAARGSSRPELFLYYSGHADESGLLLQGERLAYEELRHALEAVPADVRVAVLDACASGTFARRKGGSRQPAFLIDASSQVRGQAVLTSSTADEASQESDRIEGSFFTHHLVSGLRGAADSSSDGRVTLTEAYQFAFSETLARTEGTRGGAQHPSYDLELVGSGDLVLTDLRATSAGLVLSESLEGRLSIRDADDRLVVELAKASGRATELGLPPGRYRVGREVSPGKVRIAELTLRDRARTELGPDAFGIAVVADAVRLRGDDPLPFQPVNVGVAPGVETNALARVGPRNLFSLSIGVATAGAVDGLMLSALGGVTSGPMRGLQVGGAFGTSSGLTGLQLSGVAGINTGEARALQASGALSLSTGRTSGLQIAGVTSWSGGDFTGLQISGAVNRAPRLVGLQISVLNLGGDVDGAQIGVVNIARKVRGAQIGVFNLSDEISGLPIGLFNWVRDGRHELVVYGSDIVPANVELQLGSKWVYTILSGGSSVPASDHNWMFGAGLGVRLPIPLPVTFDFDAKLNEIGEYGEAFAAARSLGQLRLLVGVPIGSQLELVAGPTFNIAATGGAERDTRVSFLPTREVRTTRVWFGGQIGVRL